MIHAQDTKGVVIIKPTSVTANADTTGTFDTLGYDYVTIDVITDSFASSSNVPTVCKIGDGDTTTCTDIVACTGGTATSTSVGFVLPTAVSATLPAIFTRFHLDLHQRKRYLKVSLRAGTAASYMLATANLSRAAEMPATATEAGVSCLVVV